MRLFQKTALLALVHLTNGTETTETIATKIVTSTEASTTSTPNVLTTSTSAATTDSTTTSNPSTTDVTTSSSSAEHVGFCPEFVQAEHVCTGAMLGTHEVGAQECFELCHGVSNCATFSIICPNGVGPSGSCTVECKLFSICILSSNNPASTGYFVNSYLISEVTCAEQVSTTTTEAATTTTQQTTTITTTTQPTTSQESTTVESCDGFNNCDINALCSPTSDGYTCACFDGFRGNGYQCSESCELFSVGCSTTEGFTISINEECKASQYSMLDEDNYGLFVFTEDLESNPDADLSNLPDSCTFDASGTLTVSFSECGDVDATAEDDHVIYHSYINHRDELGGIKTSFLDQMPIQCLVEHVTIESGQAVNSESDEVAFNFTLSSENLIEDFDLELSIGHVVADSGEFRPLALDQPVDIGEVLTFQLEYIPTPYVFALFDCEARSGAAVIELYEGSCPSAVAERINLDWVDFTSFEMSIFKMSDRDTVTISCTVKIFPSDEFLPESCDEMDDGRRRRRAVEGDNHTDQNQVAVTLHIREDKEPKDSEVDSESGARINAGAAILCVLFAFFI